MDEYDKISSCSMRVLMNIFVVFFNWLSRLNPFPPISLNGLGDVSKAAIPFETFQEEEYLE